MAGRRASVAIKDGVVTRILSDSHTPPQREGQGHPRVEHSKSLSPDWENVLSSRRTDTISQFGFQLAVPYSEPQENIEDRPTVHFLTGSAYTGQWNNIGMGGFGTYRMPHDVEYEGELRDGMFHGDGTLIYPNGGKLFGEWVEGRMIKHKYQYSDGLQYSEHDWKYCVMPDRRFRVEHVDGLRPAGRSLKTQQIPTRVIPDGCFDTGDGFYNPVTKCVTCPKTGRVLRIPTNEEDEWIKAHCRRATDENCGYRPDLYENWFDRNFVTSSDDTSLGSDDTGALKRARTSEDLVTYDSEMDVEDTSSISFFNDMANGSALVLLERIGQRSASKLARK